MAKRDLGAPLVSLVHHVELNDSGWYKKTNARITSGVALSLGGSATREQLLAALEKIGLDDAGVWLDQQIEYLISKAIFIRAADGAFKVSEAARRSMEQEAALSASEAEECKQIFLGLCDEACADLDADQAWTLFSLTLSKAISNAGANTFKLLQGRSMQHAADWIQVFVKKFDERYWQGLESVVSAFFRSESSACRSQILRYMSASLYNEARRLPPATLSKITSGHKAKKVVRIVLDTNFVFSALELHDNPANESAKALIRLAGKQNQFLEVRLFVLPGTIEEAVETLVIQKERIERIRATRSMVGAAVTAPLSSINMRFFAAARESPGLTADAFFDPYIHGMKEILKGRSISVLEASPAVYHQRQDVVDDVADETTRQAGWPEKRRKPYATLLHDVVFWHVIQDRRLSNITSPLDVDYWGVSIDWRFIAFDKRKRESLRLPLPTVLFPTNLVQLLQFWLPRDEDLEKSLVESLGISAFLRSFDAEDERATIRILQALSRYAELDDLPEEVIAPVLANQALRARIREGNLEDEKVLELIKQELIAEIVSARETAEKLREQLGYAAVETEALRGQSEEMAETIKAQVGGLKSVGEAFEQSERDRRELADRLKLVEDALVVERAASETSGKKRRIGVVYAAVLCASLFCGGGAYLAARQWEMGLFDQVLAVAAAVFGVAFVAGKIAERLIESRKWAIEWRFRSVSRWITNGAGWLLLGTAGTIAQDAISDHIRSLPSAPSKVPKSSAGP